MQAELVPWFGRSGNKHIAPRNMCEMWLELSSLPTMYNGLMPPVDLFIYNIISLYVFVNFYFKLEVNVVYISSLWLWPYFLYIFFISNSRIVLLKCQKRAHVLNLVTYPTVRHSKHPILMTFYEVLHCLMGQKGQMCLG